MRQLPQQQHMQQTRTELGTWRFLQAQTSNPASGQFTYLYFSTIINRLRLSNTPRTTTNNLSRVGEDTVIGLVSNNVVTWQATVTRVVRTASTYTDIIFSATVPAAPAFTSSQDYTFYIISGAGGEGGTPAPSDPPPAPTRLVLTPTSGQLEVSWTPPAGTVTGYNVQYTVSQTVTQNTAPTGNENTGWVSVNRGTETDPPTTSQTITGLTDDIQYRVIVRAVNANGNSAWLEGRAEPGDQTSPVAGNLLGVWNYASGGSTTPRSGQFTLALSTLYFSSTSQGQITNPREGLNNLTTLRRGDIIGSINSSGTELWRAAVSIVLPGNTVVIFTGGIEGTAPTVDGQAYNINLISSGTPPEPTAAPGEPTNFVAEAGAERLRLNWTVPTGATDYDIHVTTATEAAVPNTSTNAGVNQDRATGWRILTWSGSVPPLTVTNLTNDEEVRFRLRAKNTHGMSDWVFAKGTPRADAVPPAPTVPSGGDITILNLRDPSADIQLPNPISGSRVYEGSVMNLNGTIYATNDIFDLVAEVNAATRTTISEFGFILEPGTYRTAFHNGTTAWFGSLEDSGIEFRAVNIENRIREHERDFILDVRSDLVASDGNNFYVFNEDTLILEHYTIN